MPKVILQYKMHTIKNAQRYFCWTPFFKVEEQTFLKSYNKFTSKNMLLLLLQETRNGFSRCHLLFES